MVYFEPVDLGLTPLIKNWINSLPKDFPLNGIDLINELLDFSLEKGRLIFNYFVKKYFLMIKKKGFKFFEQRKNCTSFPFHKQNVLNTLFGLMSSFIEFFHKHGDGFGEESHLNGILMFII